MSLKNKNHTLRMWGIRYKTSWIEFVVLLHNVTEHGNIFTIEHFILRTFIFMIFAEPDVKIATWLALARSQLFPIRVNLH